MTAYAARMFESPLDPTCMWISGALDGEDSRWSLYRRPRGANIFGPKERLFDAPFTPDGRRLCHDVAMRLLSGHNQQLVLAAAAALREIMPDQIGPDRPRRSAR